MFSFFSLSLVSRVLFSLQVFYWCIVSKRTEVFFICFFTHSKVSCTSCNFITYVELHTSKHFWFWYEYERFLLPCAAHVCLFFGHMPYDGPSGFALSDFEFWKIGLDLAMKFGKIYRGLAVGFPWEKAVLVRDFWTWNILSTKVIQKLYSSSLAPSLNRLLQLSFETYGEFT